MRISIGAAASVVAMFVLSSCGTGHEALTTGRDLPALAFPAPLMKRLASEARTTARSLGDPSVRTAQIYGPDSRYLLVKASSGDLVQKLLRERKGFYLIVLHGHFVCKSCSAPAGANLPRGKIATSVWSPRTGGTDFGLSNGLPATMSRLASPTVISLG